MRLPVNSHMLSDLAENGTFNPLDFSFKLLLHASHNELAEIRFNSSTLKLCSNILTQMSSQGWEKPLEALVPLRL